MANISLTFSSRGYNKLTKQLMVNAIDTDPYIKETLTFLLKPSNKEVNDYLDVRYIWKNIHNDKVNVLLGFLFFIPQDEYCLINNTKDKLYGIYEEKSNDYIEHTQANFALQSRINRERMEKENPKKDQLPEEQLANFINKIK